MLFTTSKAKRTFARLQALDVSAAERAALVEAGVSVRTATALYPGEGFPSLTPHLIEHLATVSGEQLAQPNHLRGRINGLADRVTRHGKFGITKERSPWRGQREALEGELNRYLLGRLTPHLSGFINYEAATEHAITLAQGIWWAHWGMSHRSNFKLADRWAIDRLMLAAARRINL